MTAPSISTGFDSARQRAISARRRRDLLIASTSVLVFFGVLVGVLVTSPGWPVVQEFFFNPIDAKRVLPELFKVLWLTVALFLTAEPVILLIALSLALLRGLSAPIFTPLRLVAVVYTDVVRGIPTILLLFIFVFGIPALQLQGVPNSPLLLGWSALVVSYSAYVTEVLRAGLESVHPSQQAAARALGLGRTQSLRFVVIPQAVRRVIPPLLNDFISLQKDTALVGLVGIVELFKAAQIDISYYFNYTALVVVALFYVAMTVPLSRYADWMSARQRRRSQSAGGAL